MDVDVYPDNENHGIAVEEAKHIREHINENDYPNLDRVIVYGPHDFRMVASLILQIKGSDEEARRLAKSYSEKYTDVELNWCGKDGDENLYGAVDEGSEFENFAN